MAVCIIRSYTVYRIATTVEVAACEQGGAEGWLAAHGHRAWRGRDDQARRPRASRRFVAVRRAACQ